MIATKTITKTAVGGGSKRFQKYLPCAGDAHRRAEDDAGRREPIRNPGNLELYYFLRAVQQVEDASQGGHSGWTHGLRKAVQNVGQHPTRIRTGQQLRSVSGIGDFTAKLVEEVLWREYPPAAADSEEEQLEDEVRQAQALPQAGAGAGERGRGRGAGREGRAGPAAAAAAAAALGPHDIPFGAEMVLPPVGGTGAGDGDTEAGAVAGRGRGRGKGRARGAAAAGGSAAGRGRVRGGRKRGAPDVDSDGGSDGGGGGFGLGGLGGLDPLALYNVGLGAGLGVGGARAGGSGACGAYGGAEPGVDAGLGGVEGAGGSGGRDGAAGAAPPRKRARRQSGEAGPQEYVPDPGTANYAFLVVMYMAWKRERRRQWEKEELMEAAQASGLAAKDVHGVKDLSRPGNHANFYNGWSCFRSLITRNPPVASERTRGKGLKGKEYTLTNVGWAMAARLYKSALRYQEVQPLPDVDEEQVDEDIRRYCEVEDVEPVLQAYPHGTPVKPRGRAYRGFQPPPRAGTEELPAGQAPAGPAAPAPAAPRARGRGRKPRSSLESGPGNDDDDGIPFGSQGNAGPGLLGSQEVYGGSQGLLAGSQGLHATQLPQVYGAGGATAGVLLPGLAAQGLTMADILTQAGRAYDRAACPAFAAAAAAAAANGNRNSSRVPPIRPAAAAAAAEMRAAVAGVMPTTQPALAAAACVGVGGPSGRGPPARQHASVDVVDLLDSSDDDDGAAAANRDTQPQTRPLDRRQQQPHAWAQEAQPLPLGLAQLAEPGAPPPRAVRGRGLVRQEDLERMVTMGFDRRLARKALLREGGDFSAAMDRLDDGTLSPAGVDSSEEEGEEAGRPRAGLAAVKPEDNPAGADQGWGAGGAAIAGACAAPSQVPAEGGAAALRLPPYAATAGVGVAPVCAAVAGNALGRAKRPRPTAGATAAAAEAATGLGRAGSGSGSGLLAGSQVPPAGFDPGYRASQEAGPSTAAAAGGAGLGNPGQGLVGMGSGAQQRYDGPSQQLARAGSQQQPGGGGSGSGNQGEEADGTADASDDKTLCTYEWQLPRVSDVTANHRALPVRLPPLQPGQRFEDAYEVVLLADNREPQPLLDALRRQAAAQGIRMVAGMSLSVGDFVWVAARRGAPLNQSAKDNWFVLDAVLERKRVGDLLSSVHEGRYGQQKFRLKRCGLRRLYYLLEEPIKQPHIQAIDEKALRTAIQSTQLEGFTVLRTANLEDTARQLCVLTRALERQYRGRTQSEGAAGQEEAADDPLLSYTRWDAGLKNLKQNMKVQAMFGLMLCAVQGMGEERVSRVLARYSTPAVLWESYKVTMRTAAAAGRDPKAAAEQLLANEIGSLYSARVYQMLFSKGV